MILGVEDFSDNNNNNKNISREGIMFEGTNIIIIITSMIYYCFEGKLLYCFEVD